MIYLDIEKTTPDFLKSIGFMDAISLLDRYGYKQSKFIVTDTLVYWFNAERSKLESCNSHAEYRHEVIEALKSYYETDDEESAIAQVHKELHNHLYCFFDDEDVDIFLDDNEADDGDDEADGHTDKANEDDDFVYVVDITETGVPMCYLYADLDNEELNIKLNNDGYSTSEVVIEFLATKFLQLAGKYGTTEMDDRELRAKTHK